jgi:protein O-GlcNAc transferase
VTTVAEVFALAWQSHQAGELSHAEKLYRQILQTDPSHVDALAYLGALCQAQGRYAEAESSFQRVVQLVPGHAKAQNCLATVQVHQGKLNEAAASLQLASLCLPDNADIHNNLGTILARLGRTSEAVDYFRLASRQRASFAQAHYNLGLALRKLDKNEEAITEFREALRCAPEFAAAMHDLGHALVEVGRLSEAENSYRQVLRLHPDYAEAHVNLGSTLQSLDRLDEAVACFHQALRLNPRFAEAYYNLGNALQSLDRFEDAGAAYNQAVRLNPQYVEAYNNLGLAHARSGRLDEAVACHRRALQLKPDVAEIHINLAGALKKQEQFFEALIHYRRALELQPNNPPVVAEIVHHLQLMCLWEDLEVLSRRVIESVGQESMPGVDDSVSPFAFLSLPTTTTAQQQLQCARKYIEQLLGKEKSGVRCPVSDVKNPACSTSDFGHRTPDSGLRTPDRIAVGYLSADFHEHATAYLIAEMIERHDRARVAVIGYSIGTDDSSPMRKRLEKAFDRFVNLKDAKHAEAAMRIREDRVDILVDLKGYTRHSRSQIMALRPAPIQAHYLGYPGTMAASFIDYVLVDDFVVPPDQQPYFTEQLVHLPGCYQVNDKLRETAAYTPSRTECGLPDAGLVFCCFNNTYKFTPQVFDVWMRLLNAIPGSVLWLLEANRFVRANLQREARKRAVASERLVFAPPVPMPQHLARHRLADLFLDTLPYNAHTTASDALWMGCPVMTVAGQTFASRVAGSLLRAVGLPELITTSLPEYEELALRLARDPDLLATLRARLRTNRETSALFDGAQFARNIEQAYITMWDIYTSGKPPRAFAVNPIDNQQTLKS